MRRNKHGDEVRKGFFLAPVGGGVQDGLSALLPAPSSRCFHCELVSLTDLSCYLQNHFFFSRDGRRVRVSKHICSLKTNIFSLIASGICKQTHTMLFLGSFPEK